MTVAAVELWGTRIGAVALTQPNGVASFQYDPAFLASGIQLAPLMMPLSDRIFSFPELSPRSFRGRARAIAEEVLTAVRSWPRFAEEAGIDEPVQAAIQATYRLNLLDP